jgi:hypothetical protein
MARGVDVFELVPTEHLSQSEIDAAKQIRVDVLNVQNQERFVWPSNLITARAYLDQLTRSKALSPDKISAINAAIEKADNLQLQGLATSLEKDATAKKNPADKERIQKIATIFKSLSSTAN